MAEVLLKSKLKRKKSSTEGQQVKVSPSGALNRSHPAVFCSKESTEPRRGACPAAEWWSGGQLTSAETLWALTLQSALPPSEKQLWQLVPELPCSSESRRPPALGPDEQRWCDLSEEVAPFPEPFPALPRTSSSPNPSSSSPEAALSAQTPPEAAAAAAALDRAPVPSDAGPRPEEEEATAPGGLPEARRPFLLARGTGPTSASPAAAHSHRSAEDACQNQEGAGEERGEDCRDGEAAAAASSTGGGGGGGGLQSCPMCLLEFPAGFTQMECDGHLAQCLSEVNVDVTW